MKNIRVCVFVFSAALLAACSESDQSQAICFNNEPNPEKYGIWVYENSLNWKQARQQRSSAFVMGYSSGKSTFNYNELVYCFYIDGSKDSDFCKEGTLNIVKSEKDSLAGSYSFVLKSGRTKSGGFNAVYCPPD